MGACREGQHKSSSASLITFAAISERFPTLKYASLNLFEYQRGGEKMWHLIEHFFDQNIVMKAMIGFGWLCVLIMVSSFAEATWNKFIVPMMGG